MKNIQINAAIGFLILLTLSLFSCSHTEQRTPAQAAISVWMNENQSRRGPANEVQILIANYEKKARSIRSKLTAGPVRIEQMQKVAHYIDYLHIPDSIKTDTVNRLFESSLSFLFCEDMNDWVCLEKKSPMTPLAAHRFEADDLFGEPVQLNEDLQIQYFFTKQWYKNRKNLINEPEVRLPEKASLALELENIIDQNWDRISAAIYGMDGLGEIDAKTREPNFSMQGVFNVLVKNNNTRAVVDVERHNNPQAQLESSRMYEFQYAGTQKLIDQLNVAQDTESRRVRAEWPAANIMHNKFFVFEKNRQKSVWTGTANISKNCTGDEDFSNLAVYINNTAVADSFLTEFNEMFNYASRDQVRATMPVGRFHRNKTVNTKRYFQFKDGSELRVHFSPTDDGEHRSIIPMLLSANEGDIIRISMFGSAGVEYIRAMQYAAARGAQVKVFVDRDTSFQISNSWINRKSPVRLQEKNPYAPVKGSLEIRHTNWLGGSMNHHKSATLTRKIKRGYRPELIIVGSQNWSLAGNDDNDENMLTIRNQRVGLPVVEDFNQHFDRMLWATGQIVDIE